jgi:signal transduction histidine kinase
MSLIGILDFIIFLITLSSFGLILIGWNSQFSLITRLSLIALFSTVSFYYLSNFLEWSKISDIFVNIEDYVAMLAPLAWFFFIYTYLQKKEEENLLKNQENIKEAYRYTEFYKDLFTHDIRNILQNILLAENVIEQSNDEKNQLDNINEVLTLVREQIIRGENLISNVTKLSEIRNAPSPINSVNIQNILPKTVEKIKKIYEHREINVRIPDGIFMIKANDLFENIIENLLFNGIMHNKNKIIEFIIQASRQKINQTPHIRIEFIDNGIGIPDSRKEEIFLTREEEESKFKTGLGLSLIRKIIEYYEGKIWVEDKVKGDHTKGSNFIILIPEA